MLPGSITYGCNLQSCHHAGLLVLWYPFIILLRTQSIIQEVSYFCYYSFSKLTIFKTSVRVCVCYRLRSNKFIYWNPNPQCDNIWKKGLWEVVCLRYEIMRVEPHDEISALPTRRKEIRDFPLFLPCENTVRKWPSIGKEEDSHQESNWPPPWS